MWKKTIAIFALFIFIFGSKPTFAQTGKRENSDESMIELVKKFGQKNPSRTLSSERTRFIANFLKIYRYPPAFLLYFNGFIPFIKSIKNFLSPLPFPQSKLNNIPRKFSKLYKRKFRSLEDVLQFWGLDTELPISVGAFKLSPKSRFSYGLSVFIPIKNKDKFLKAFYRFLKDFAPDAKVFREKTGHYIYREPVIAVIKDRLFSVVLARKKDRIKVINSFRRFGNASIGMNQIFFHPLKNGELYFYGDIEQLFYLIKRFSQLRAGKNTQRIEQITDIAQNIFLGLKSVHLKLSANHRSLKVESSVMYGTPKSLWVKELFNWKSKYLHSISLLPKGTFFILSINALDLYLSLAQTVIGKIVDSADRLFPKEKASQIAIGTAAAIGVIDKFKSYIKDEMTIAISTSKESPLQISLLLKSPAPTKVIKTLNPYIVRSFPQFSVQDVGYRGVLFKTLKKRENYKKSKGKIILPSGTFAWGAIGKYIIVTFELSKGYNLMKSFINRFEKRQPTLTILDPILSGRSDFLLHFSLRTIRKFIESSPPFRRVYQLRRLQPALKFLDSITIKSENVTRNRRFYRTVIRVKKSRR